MSHVDRRKLHLYKNRALTVTIAIKSDLTADDLSEITLRIPPLEVTDLTAVDTATGFEIDLDLTDAQTNTLERGISHGELLATIGGESTTLMTLRVSVGPEPTPDV